MVTNTHMNNVSRPRPVGFGAATPRFGKVALHPNLDINGVYKIMDRGCDPCLYHPIPVHEIFRVNKNRTDVKDVWRFKAELEDWCKNLGYRNQRILQYRRYMASVGGPAWCEPRELPKHESACKNLGFGTAPRYIPKRCYVPPPGTYYKATPYKAPYGPHSTLPSFEWGEPCRFPDKNPKWSLAPDRYHVIDKGDFEQTLKRIVSRRGPYDLFTGKRDASTIISHFNGRKCPAASWPIALPGSFEGLKKTRTGVMNKTGRDKSFKGRKALVDIAMAIRRPSDPGPADTNVDKPRTFKDNNNPFNNTEIRFPGKRPTPGVGRYKVQGISCGILGQGHKHVFLSKIQRTMGCYLPKPMNTF